MKKENVLVVALIVIAMGGIYVFNALNSKGGDTGEALVATASVPNAQDGSEQGLAYAGTSSGIQWKDYTPGMAMARKENKSIFLYFHAPWCTYCVKLKKTSFKDEQVLAYLNANFTHECTLQQEMTAT